MAEGERGAALVPAVAGAAWVSVSSDWRRLYEEARERSEAAEAHAEELKRAALAARCDAGGWRWQFESARRKRLLALEEAKEARRPAKDALALKAEVGRLRQLLAEAGVESRRYRPMALRREVVRLRKAVPGAEVQARKIRELHRALLKDRDDTASLRRLLRDTVWRYADTRRLRDQQDRIASLLDDVGQLRHELRRSEAGKERLKERLRRAVETVRSRSPGAAALDLRKALRRSLRQKAALRRLSQEHARLRRRVKTSARRNEIQEEEVARLRGRLEARGQRIEAQELEIARLRATRAVLSKALHGRRSEMRERPGFPGPGRTARPGLEERSEEHHPPREARRCLGCGEPYVAVGGEESALFEIEVRAHRRVIRRSRWRRGCGCASSPRHVVAPPVPRLFPNTAYGTSVWARVLYERLGAPAPGLPPVRRRRGRPGRLDRDLAGEDRPDLPPERGAAGPLRARPGTAECGVRRGAGPARDGARSPVRHGRAGTRRPAGRRPRGQGAALAGEPPRGAHRLRRPSPGPARQQPRRAAAPGAGHRAAPVLRIRQRNRGAVHRADVLRGRHPEPEPDRCPALARSVAVRQRGHGGRPPEDLARWLPWSMDAPRRREMAAPT